MSIEIDKNSNTYLQMQVEYSMKIYSAFLCCNLLFYIRIFIPKAL